MDFYLFQPCCSSHMLVILLEMTPGLKLLIQLKELTKRKREVVGYRIKNKGKIFFHFFPLLELNSKKQNKLLEIRAVNH